MTLEYVATEQLTRREREIVALLMAGESSYDVLAARLCVAPTTVHFHMGSIFRKLGLSERAQVVAYAWLHGITVDGEWYPNADNEDDSEAS